MADASRFLVLMLINISMLYNLASAQDSDNFVYNGFLNSSLRLDGLAQIRPNGLLQLTNATRSQSGHAFHQLPLKFNTKNSSAAAAAALSFSTTFVFAIVPASSNDSGHGIAFVISPSMDFSYASAVEFLGLFNISNDGLQWNRVLAIEFDTIESASVNDIDDNHVGIDVNSVKSFRSATSAYFSNKDGENRSVLLKSGHPIQAWIDYDGTEKLLNVSLAPINTPKPSKNLLSTSIDLSEIFMESMYVGFSASTGTVVHSNQFILGWSFNKRGKAQDLNISKLPDLPTNRNHDDGMKRKLMISGLVVGVVVVLVIGGIWTVRRNRFAEIWEDWENEYGPHRFSYKTLYKATNGFKDNNLLGSGGFGKVYKGVLPRTKEQIAVKRFSHDSGQGMKEFIAEIVSMGRVKHRNLVQLLGYCRRRGELLLVYDYVPNGSLDKFLFSHEEPNLTWSQRFLILKDVASGILYLHEESEQIILHRDIKASNVLLDADLSGRLGDFGLARLHKRGTNLQTTNVVGTVGYLAPEVIRQGTATTSTDVYAFGAFMLEVACGRRPIDLQAPPEQRVLVDWVLDCWKKGDILIARDPKLREEFVRDEMLLTLKLGLICSQSEPTARPNMRRIMQYLEGVFVLPQTTYENIAIDSCTTAEVSDIVTSAPLSSYEVMSICSSSSLDAILNTYYSV